MTAQAVAALQRAPSGGGLRAAGSSALHLLHLLHLLELLHALHLHEARAGAGLDLEHVDLEDEAVLRGERRLRRDRALLVRARAEG